MSAHEEPRGVHPWRMVRRDIGRKVTALAMAVLLWFYLSNTVGGGLEDHPLLGVSIKPDRQSALSASQSESAVYLIVPDDLIVRDDLSKRQVELRARGLKDELDGLRLSAFVPISVDALQGADERQVDILLQDRDLFHSRGRGREPELKDFEVRVRGGGGRLEDRPPGSLRLTLALKDEASFLLGPDNVMVVGSPREGNAFDKSAIRVHPNRVTVSGPRKIIEWLRADPSQLKVGPVDLEGRSFDVSQQVGIHVSIDRTVTLDTAGQVVEVTVPIRALDMVIDLPGVPVAYVGAEDLQARGLRVVSADETLDLKVSGSRSVLGGLSQEELVKLIHLQVDWSDVELPRGKEFVHVFRDLPQAPVVRITDRAENPPRVEYHLEDISMDAASNGAGNGDTP